MLSLKKDNDYLNLLGKKSNIIASYANYTRIIV